MSQDQPLKPGAIVQQRYQLTEPTRGEAEQTWLARDLASGGAQVVVEFLRLGEAPAIGAGRGAVLDQGFFAGFGFAVRPGLGVAPGNVRASSSEPENPSSDGAVPPTRAFSPLGSAGVPFAPPGANAPSERNPFAGAPSPGALGAGFAGPQPWASPPAGGGGAGGGFSPMQHRPATPMASPRGTGWLAVVVLAVLVVFAIGVKVALTYSSQGSSNSASSGNFTESTAPQPLAAMLDSPIIPVGLSPVLGSPSAPVTIVEFGDFECPYCERVQATIDMIRARYGNQVRIVWKNNPLPFHPNAMLAAEAAMEAHAQGRFEPMHRLLFANRRALSRPDLEGYAAAIGLNMLRFRNALDLHTHQPAILADQALARTLSASGTPAFFINGRNLSGAQPFSRFQTEIDAALLQAASITPSTMVYAQSVAMNYGSGRALLPPYRRPPPQATLDPSVTYRVPAAGAPSLGPADALVTIVEFSDFECPFCDRVRPTIDALRARYASDLRVVFRHNPLSFHPNAMNAARVAVEAYHQRGSSGFWAMHDLLFDNRSALQRGPLEALAVRAGLRLPGVRNALDMSVHDAEINADIAIATRLTARGVPAFFVNGRHLSGAQPEANFVRLIEEVRTEALRLVAAGVPRSQVYDRVMSTALVSPPAP